MSRCMLIAAVVGCSWVAATACWADEKVPLDKVPEKIMGAVKGRFSEPELLSVEKETEDGNIVFDVELKEKGRKFEMDVKEDGTIIEIEKQIAVKDFPEAGVKAVEAKYPQATIAEIMEVDKVQGKTETSDHYELLLELADKKTHEVVVSLDGKAVTEEQEETTAKK